MRYGKNHSRNIWGTEILKITKNESLVEILLFHDTQLI